MQPKKILLIEDEEYIRDLYKRQLELAHLSTDGFGTGAESLAAASKNHYDLVMLDIMLPDTNGLEILKALKGNPATKNIPVVLLTNLGQDTIIKKCFELGAEGYLLKSSYTPDQIVQEIKDTLEGKKSPPTL